MGQECFYEYKFSDTLVVAENSVLFNDLEFTWDGISQRNRNPLLSMNLGADGLKTVYTDEAGYGLIASAKQNERRITFVITGLN